MDIDKIFPERILSFETVNVGDEVAISHLITEQDVQQFASLTKDFNPLHHDEIFARRTVFRKPVIHGMLSASFISTLIGMVLPGPGALWTSQTLEFINPAYVGDRLTVSAKVKQKSLALRTLILSICVVNSANKLIITGEATVKSLELKQVIENKNGLTGRNVLVTGGSRGIGAAVARHLAEKGYGVIINYCNSAPEAYAITESIKKQGGRAWAIKADLANSAEVKAMYLDIVKNVGEINAMVYCAAAPTILQTFDKLEWDLVQKQFDIQLQGAFRCIKAILPAMVANKDGSIVFIGSVATDGIPPVAQTDYVIAKAAISAFAKSLAAEFGPQGIRVNIVAPGMTQTERVSVFPEKARMLTKMQTPLRQLADPEDIALAVEFLLGPGGRHITGETLRVSGGAVMV